MDRPGRRALALAFGAVAAAGAVAATVDPPVRALAWLPPGADPASALDRPPPECLATPVDADAAYLVEVGRAAFATPLVLGGQAARAGISCESCHQAGRANLAFRFPGVSGAPGTADVTSSMFSSHRGDGLDNPEPIPDLGGPKSALKVSQADGPALASFIRGLVVEEFDGREPPAAVLQGLATYVRALDPAACPASGAPVTLAAMMGEARRAGTAALAALDRDDRDTALTMVAAARWRLGLIDERFAGAGLREADARLRASDAVLAAVADRIREAPPLGPR